MAPRWSVWIVWLNSGSTTDLMAASEILRYIHIALLCVDVNPETRPSIDEVLHWFSCLSTPLPEPRIGNQSLEEEETNWLSAAPSPGYGSPMSHVSPR